MVLTANTGLLFSDEDSLRPNPGSSSSVSSDQNAGGGCLSRLRLLPSLFRSDQQQNQTVVESLRERCEQQELELLNSTREIQEASAKARAAEEAIESLTAQVSNLRQRCEQQELELQKSTKETQEAKALAVKEVAKSRAIEEVTKLLTIQVSNLIRQIWEQEELELQRSTKKTQEAMAKAAEEIIKPLKAQLEDMTKRLTRYGSVANQQNQKLASITGTHIAISSDKSRRNKARRRRSRAKSGDKSRLAVIENHLQDSPLKRRLVTA